MNQYFVYIMANYTNTTIYVGVTNDLERRVYEHKHELINGFSSRYKTKKLVYFETTNDIYEALTREKQIKGMKRERKDDLIGLSNPNWDDILPMSF